MTSKLSFHITEENFDELVFESCTPVIVFFGAKHCRACSMLAPIVKEVSIDYQDKLNVYSVDVDEYEALARRFRLNGIPTLLIFKDGELKERITGFYPKNLLEDLIKSTLNFSA